MTTIRLWAVGTAVVSVFGLIHYEFGILRDPTLESLSLAISAIGMPVAWLLWRASSKNP